MSGEMLSISVFFGKRRAMLSERPSDFEIMESKGGMKS
jgi:hypothetical protein